MNQEFAERAGIQSCYFITTCDGKQSQKNVDDIHNFISDLQNLTQKGLFNMQQIDDYVVPINTEHPEYLGFYGRSLKFVQNISNKDATGYVLADFSSDDEKAPEYAKQLLAL